MATKKKEQATKSTKAPASGTSKKAAEKPTEKKKRTRAPRSPEKKILAEKEKERLEGEKRGPGRPIKLTHEIQSTICNAVRAGNYMETAAAMAGVDKTTVYDWMKRGARGDGEFIEFSHAIKKALAESEVGVIAGIRTAGKESWQALAWLAERRFRQRWGRSISVTSDLDSMSDEELIALLEEADSE